MRDVVLGVAVGVAQGWLFFLMLQGSFRFSILCMSRMVKSHAARTFIAALIGIFFVSMVLLLTLLAKPVVVVWNNYLAGFLIGFFIGMIGYRVTSGSRNRIK